MSTPAVRFVLYSEDSGKRALETLEHLLRGMLKHVCPSVKLNHVTIEPVLPPDERVTGSSWKSHERSRQAQRLRHLLLGAVARQLALGKVVCFHVDADAIWRADATTDERNRDCENLGTHWPKFCRDVLARWGTNKDQTELERVLILVMPFYEIESWAYANTRRLRQVLTDASDLAVFTRWEADLGELDEIADIKDALSIGDQHNAELVQARHGFSAAALDGVGKSYSATVARLRASQVACRGLEAAAAREY